MSTTENKIPVRSNPPVNHNYVDKKGLAKAQLIAAFLLGVFLPILLIGYSAFDLKNTSDQLYTNLSDNYERYEDLTKELEGYNDYTLFSMMFKDLGFNHTFINKQKMKTSVMFIGLAVICIGMSFIMLGVNQGGGELSSNSELNFNLTIGSTGLAAILIGAYLVFSGGTTNNEYRPGGIPGFLYSSETGASIGSQFSEAEHKMAGCLKLATSTINEFSKQTNKTPIKNDFIQAAIDCTTDNIIEYYSGIHDENKK